MGLGHALYRSSSKWNQQRMRDAARSRRERARAQREEEQLAARTPQQARVGLYDMDALRDSVAERINAAIEAQGSPITLVRLTCTLTGKQTGEYHASFSDGYETIEPVRISADGESWQGYIPSPPPPTEEREEGEEGEEGDSASDPVEQLRRLAELRDIGVITGAEFNHKKTELLSRI
jgi:hypothetical protein